MWYKSYNIILNIQTFGAKCSPDVKIPPVLLSAFTAAHSKQKVEMSGIFIKLIEGMELKLKMSCCETCISKTGWLMIMWKVTQISIMQYNRLRCETDNAM